MSGNVLPSLIPIRWSESKDITGDGIVDHFQLPLLVLKWTCSLEVLEWRSMSDRDCLRKSCPTNVTVSRVQSRSQKSRKSRARLSTWKRKVVAQTKIDNGDGAARNTTSTTSIYFLLLLTYGSTDCLRLLLGRFLILERSFFSFFAAACIGFIPYGFAASLFWSILWLNLFGLKAW